jgi:hypothetical protein
MNFFEVVHPLNSGDPEDLAVAHGAVVGYCLRYFQDNSASDATTYPVGCAGAGADLSGYAELIVR